MVDEVWKDIDKYEGLYKISNYGNILSFKTHNFGKLMKPSKDKDGYYQIGLRDISSNRKWFRVHRLVALAFIENTYNYEYINHKDMNTSNNYFENIEWCTVEYNNKYRFSHGNANNKGENGSRATISNKDADEIRKLWNTGQYSVKDLMNKFECGKGVIDGVIGNHTFIDDNYIKIYDGRLNFTGVKNKSSKLNEEQIKEIRKIYIEQKTTYKNLADKYSVSKKTIENIIKLKKWKSV